MVEYNSPTFVQSDFDRIAREEDFKCLPLETIVLSKSELLGQFGERHHQRQYCFCNYSKLYTSLYHIFTPLSAILFTGLMCLYKPFGYRATWRSFC